MVLSVANLFLESMNENSPGEPGSIEKIPLDLRSYLRSGVAISSFTQCIEELVIAAVLKLHILNWKHDTFSFLGV